MHADRDMIDAWFRKVTAGMTPQHCSARALPIGDGRWECAADDAVFGPDYDQGTYGWRGGK